MTPRRLALAMAACVLLALGPATAQEIKPGGVLIFGGSGRTGVEIAKLLIARGDTVTLFVRPSSKRDRIAGVTAPTVEGDAMVAADVDAAFAKAKPRTAVNAIGGRGTQMGFWDTTQKNITAAAKKSGAKEVVFLSSVGVGDSAAAYAEEARVRTKDAMAERFAAEEDMKTSGLDYVIIRTGIIAPENMAATGQARLTEDRMSLKPVTRADLAALTVDCLGNAKCRNKTFAAEDLTIKLSR